MSEADIDWRTPAEGQVIEAKRFPDKHTAKHMKGGKSSASLLPGLPRPIDRKRHNAGIAAAAAAKKRQTALRDGGYTRPCCWPGCAETTTRRPSEFNAPVWFCGHAHANRYRFASPQTREECLENARRHIEGY